jgi:hypothetical protein
VCDYCIRCELTILLRVLYYGCFNFVSCNMCVCFCNMYTLTFSVFCLCTYLYCFVVILLFCAILMFCSCFVVIVVSLFCVILFLSVLPPGESPIAVSSSSSSSSGGGSMKKLYQNQ